MVSGTPTYYVGSWYEVTNGAATKYYYFGNQRVAMRNANGVTYLHSDHLGSTSVASTDTGAFHSRQTYYAFGVPRTTEGTLPTDFTFTGQRADSSAGLMYYNARYYDSAIGRFIQADSIIPDQYNPQSLNRFAYVKNNPVKYTDPTGHMEACDDGCGTPGKYVPEPPVEPRGWTWSPFDERIPVLGDFVRLGIATDPKKTNMAVKVNLFTYDVTVTASLFSNVGDVSAISTFTNTNFTVNGPTQIILTKDPAVAVRPTVTVPWDDGTVTGGLLFGVKPVDWGLVQFIEGGSVSIGKPIGSENKMVNSGLSVNMTFDLHPDNIAKAGLVAGAIATGAWLEAGVTGGISMAGKALGLLK